MTTDWEQPLVPRTSALALRVHVRAGRRVRAPRRARLRVRAGDRPRPGDAAALARLRGPGGGSSRRLPPRPLVMPEDAWEAGPLPEPRAAPAAADGSGAEAPRPERAARRRSRPRRGAAAGVRVVCRVPAPLVLDAGRRRRVTARWPRRGSRLTTTGGAGWPPLRFGRAWMSVSGGSGHVLVGQEASTWVGARGRRERPCKRGLL